MYVLDAIENYAVSTAVVHAVVVVVVGVQCCCCVVVATSVVATAVGNRRNFNLGVFACLCAVVFAEGYYSSALVICPWPNLT